MVLNHIPYGLDYSHPLVMLSVLNLGFYTAVVLKELHAPISWEAYKKYWRLGLHLKDSDLIGLE